MRLKHFSKQVLASALGVLLVGIFMSICGFIMLIAVSLSSGSSVDVKDGSVLRISLDGTISERSAENPFSEFLGNDVLQKQGLDDMLKAIKMAKTDSRISGIYIEGGVCSADFATLQELRKALVDFKTSKKFIFAYADSYTQGSYYIASAADNLWVNPDGMIDWHGIASQPIFYTDLLKKVGVKMQVFKVGTYKSAVEPYILTGMSDPNREQVTSFIGDIWGALRSDVSKSRKIAEAQLDSIADNYSALTDPQRYVSSHLADSLAYIDQVRAKLRALAHQEKVNFVSPAQLAQQDVPDVSTGNQIAVYYAEGNIVDAAASTSLQAESQIVGSKVVEDLGELADDDNVKAVVLRINSGGGSAYASEQMWHAIQQLKAKKPVVVSMSGMAASGGYYMSCGADYIVAEPTTLTGSIGIFGLIPDASGLLTEKLGLHFDVVKTNQASDFGAMGRSFNESEAAAMQNYVNRGYALFLKRVAAGRHMTTEQVDQIGQGRVWTGAQALKIKLVDKLGTLDDAIAEAARRAKVKDYGVQSAPAKPSWMDQFMTSVQKKDYLEQKLRTALGEYYAPLQFVGTLNGASPKDYVQARIFFEPNLR